MNVDLERRAQNEAFRRAASEGDVATVSHLLSSAGFEAKGEVGRQALVAAVANGHQDVVDLLLSRGARANAADRTGWTPLHFAGHAGHPRVIESLLSNGADVDARTNGGSTALHVASRRGNAQAVEALVHRGADAGGRDGEGHTPADLARNGGHDDVAYVLDQALIDGAAMGPGIASSDSDAAPPAGGASRGEEGGTVRSAAGRQWTLRSEEHPGVGTFEKLPSGKVRVHVEWMPPRDLEFHVHKWKLGASLFVAIAAVGWLVRTRIAGGNRRRAKEGWTTLGAGGSLPTPATP